MTSLIFVTQAVDENDPVLGFTVGWVRALAERANVAVIASEVRPATPDIGAEIVSLGKEDGAPRWRRGVRYATALATLCRKYRPAVLFGHMCPPFVTRGAPVTKLTRTPSILWYAHPADTPALRRAERLADLVATSLPGAYPRRGDKVRPIGQAVDTARFAPRDVPRRERLELIAAGRCSPQKNYPVIIRAVALARQRGVDLKLRILGPATTEAERLHRDELRRMIDDARLSPVVTLSDGVAPDAVAHALAGASALVNASRPGVSDKVVFEAMACGRPTLVSSHTFGALLHGLPVDLRFPDGDDRALADGILRLAGQPDAVWRQTGALLRQRIVEQHSLAHWAGEVVSMAADLTAGLPQRSTIGG